MATRDPAVMENPSIVSCLLKHAIRLCRSVRHPDTGLAITYCGDDAEPGSVTHKHKLSLAVVPESQADMLDIHVSKTASQHEGTLEELPGALQAVLSHSSDQALSPSDQPITFSVKTRENPARSLGERLSDAGHGPLLQEVVSYLPDKEVLRLTRTCKNVGLVSPPAIHSKADTSADQLDWLLERELRVSTLRPRYYFSEDRQAEILQSDGGCELSKQTYLLPATGDYFTTYGLRDTSEAAHGPAHRPRMISVMSSPSTAAISTEDGLFVTVHRLDPEELDEPLPDYEIWRFESLRLEPATEKISGTRPQADIGQPHPDARLPFIDVAIRDRPHTVEGDRPKLRLTIAQDGLILFRLERGGSDDVLAIVLDWRRGEARGVMMDTSDYALGLMCHALACGQYLLSTGASHLEGPGQQMRAGLWIATIPREGRRPGRLPTLQMPASGAEGADRLYTIACDDLARIVPEAAFLLPFISGADRWSTNSVSPAYHMFNGLLSVSSVSSGAKALDALALFTFSGYVAEGNATQSARPVQCSGVAPVSHLIAAWKTSEDTNANRRPEKDGTPHGEELSPTPKQFCRIAWEDWQIGIHVFVLNTLLPPVLHGTTLIVGVAIPLKDLKLAIRDFNVNRLSSFAQLRPWHKLGLAISHPLQPKAEHIPLPDCDYPMISHSDWTITSAPMQSTRGMFETQTMQGGLKYNERVASLPAAALAMFTKQSKPCPCKQHGLDPYWDRVEKLVYDGHGLVVKTHRSDLRLAFAPLRKGEDGHAMPTTEHYAIKECQGAISKAA